MDGRDLEMRLVPPLLRMANSDVWDDAIAWLETALAHAREIGTPSLVGWVLQGLGFHLTLQGEYAAAQARLVESLMFWREDGNVWHRAYVLERLGWLASERGDAATARVWLEQSLPLYREADDLGGLAGALNTLGEVAVMQEDPARAISLLEEALRLNQARGHRPEMGWILNHLGHVAHLEGDYERARRLYEESAAFFRGTFSAQAGLAWDAYGLGEAALGYGDARLARTRFIEALGYLHSFTDHACSGVWPDWPASPPWRDSPSALRGCGASPKGSARLWGHDPPRPPAPHASGSWQWRGSSLATRPSRRPGPRGRRSR